MDPSVYKEYLISINLWRLPFLLIW